MRKLTDPNLHWKINWQADMLCCALESGPWIGTFPTKLINKITWYCA